MAKKTVVSLHNDSRGGRTYTRVTRMVKPPKTDAYSLDEQMVPNEKIQNFFKR